MEMKAYLGSMLVAFALSLLFCWVLIPVLRRLKAGQNILSYVKEHASKGGTPTMAGIAFVSAAALTAVLFIRELDRDALVCLGIGFAYMLVGLMDDLLKRKHKENLGLKAWQKLAFQLLIAIFAGIYAIRAEKTALHIPFFNIVWEMGWWVVPLSVFVFLATVNAVNLTDGLDGLAAGTSVPFFLCFGVILLIEQEMFGVRQSNEAILCFCLVGALAAYLLFNVFPASAFMGDTGSLSLGGFAAAIAVLTGNALYLAVIGGCFVLSVISVLMQVIYYKATGGKRIFLMAPIHHHFQKKGFGEGKIAFAYSVTTFVLGGICIMFAL